MGKRETSSATASNGDEEVGSRHASPPPVFGMSVDAPKPATALRHGYWRSILLALACALACLVLGSLSAAASPQDDWYRGIRKPSWMPPGWLFGVVWSVLYLLMGAAFSLILAAPSSRGANRAASLFAVQLALNLAWSPVFFRGHSLGGAMIIIILLWSMLSWTIAAFWSVRDVAGVLLLPYWAWVTFAVALNAAVWRMN